MTMNKSKHVLIPRDLAQNMLNELGNPSHRRALEAALNSPKISESIDDLLIKAGAEKLEALGEYVISRDQILMLVDVMIKQNTAQITQSILFTLSGLNKKAH